MATSYQSPGVYVEEVDRGTKPIEGVGTSVAAFVGFTERAEEPGRAGATPASLVNKATLVTNWAQYMSKFGGFVEGAFLPQAVFGYFANGGGRCYIVSVKALGADGGTPARAALPAADAKGDSLAIGAKAGGAAGNDVSVVITHQAAEGGEAKEGDSFTLVVRRGDAQAERYEGLTMAGVEAAVNTASRLVQVEVQRRGGKVAARPAEGTYALAGGGTTALTIAPPQFQGDAARREGIGALEALDDVTMVCVPDLMSAHAAGAIDLDGVKAVQGAVLAHCERMRYRFAILDAPLGMSPQAVGEWRMDQAGYDSKYGALYYPWLAMPGPSGAMMLVPPCGHVAGVYARVDGERGVHKAPANEVVLGAVGLEVNVTKGEQDGLNPMGVNCIRAFAGRGIRVWGARTLSSDPSWRYINVRRLFNFVEASIERGTQWVVFEPNDADLWARVRRDISAFLRMVWRSGALFGATPDEAFYVKCDEELNPLEVRDAGQLIIEVGMAPVKPAEFVIVRISQWAGPNAEA
ncbi:MAG TPA: phage tail sheath family protein [Anaerolineae bacterium]|nr:phage tail sheath family protein [Anaerolineae bacterium]HPL29865.1 phage tail sheath family protein [Anaerolineae bacterium]